jgi:hypothetical protein
MSDVRSVAANTVVENVLAGKLHEFVQRPSAVRLYITASAVGARASFLLQGRSIVQDQEIGAANRFPLAPDDFFAESGARPGDRVVLSVRNTTGAAITVQSKVEVVPMQ